MLLLAVLSLTACATFWPMLRGDFVYDDLWLIAQNPSLNSFGNLLSSLGGSHWDFLDARSAQFVGHWRPFTMLSLYTGSMLAHGAPLPRARLVEYADRADGRVVGIRDQSAGEN